MELHQKRIVNQLRDSGWVSGQYLALLVSDSDAQFNAAIGALVEAKRIEEREGYYRLVKARRNQESPSC